MSDLPGTVLTAAGVFAGTDVDDLLVLTTLFLAGRASGAPRPGQIWLGQYAGILILILVSGAAALGLTIVPDDWVGLLGLVPLALGVAGLIRARSGDDEPAPVAASVLSIAGVTIANGADNISVYTPLFRTIGLADSLVTVVVFTAGVAVWCVAASWLGSHRKVIAVVRRHGHWVVPAVFVAIGVVIIVESGVLGRLTGH